MDDFHQSAAPVTRRRRSVSGRRLLGLLVVLALVLMLPARALADRTSTLLVQPTGTGIALTSDSTSEDQPPTDPAPTDPTGDTSEPAPAPSDPTPAPSDPAPSDPAPSDPTPPPSDPAPTEPAPSDPAPAPSDPAPAPSDPAPPSDEVPVDPTPAPSEPAPSDPAPRDGRATTPKPPASDERQLPSTAPTTTPLTPLAPATSTPTVTDKKAADPAKPADKAGDPSPTKVVRAAFKRLGLGTIAAPAPLASGTPTTAGFAQACTPIGTIAAADAPQAGTGLTPRTTVRTHRTEDEPPTVRGPPAPLDSPTSPIATAAGASAGTGGASGGRDCAVLTDQIIFTLADRGHAAASDSSDYVAPASANAAARAPPVV